MKRVLHTLLGALILSAHLAYADTPDHPKFLLTTNAFQHMMAMPTLYTCDGKNIAPEFSWSKAPAGTQTFALIIEDIDVPNSAFYHWIVYNIPNNVRVLPQDTALPPGCVVGKNSFSKDEYSGPCPPKGKAHDYVYSLYALNTNLNLPKGADGEAVLAAIKGHIISQADMTGIYSRWIE